ncbi:uncharacterized protein LOC110448015 [Mizuhopecten yessoensis]|uniref:Uncharacterized protein n=1 Tax=Mizuhopecten yessoensis TaxID=6573 RepID=A0A210QTZ7_MIZYE|nr:uncharacterized protein LOC110448015 [Mizuhopecten yessoensis]XP_021349716.1 uncharacterized protein LOC110448015 [Mizuhopecten yessoensis]XP_021349717.1 uncharacterized protein LOC110448015 [Mizuhopecten yessoensis]OWF52243.1 hypothetical protein KP79_PYT03678 [Mizuhopecten yessoensis]
MYVDNETDAENTGTGLSGTFIAVATFNLIIIVAIASCAIPRCHKKSRRELKPRFTVERKTISQEDVSTVSTSSKSAPKKPIRHSPSTHSNKQKNVQNYENVFVGVYRGNFASPSVSQIDSADVLDNESSASDPFIDPKEENVNSHMDNNRTSYEEQCDNVLERHISVRYENNNDQFDDVVVNKRESSVNDKYRSKGSVEISINVNSRV